MEKKITAIVQARTDSNRLKSKVLKKISGRETILILLDRLSQAKSLDKIIVAIPNSQKNKKLKKVLLKNNYEVFEGSHTNVLKRYYDCGLKYSLKHIMRVTGDCPLLDPKLVDKLANKYKRENYDYVSNIEKRTFPDGMDLEIFSFKILDKANKIITNKNDREHVTTYFLRSNKIKKFNLVNQENFSNLSITLDNIYDLKLISFIIKNIKKKYFNCHDIINFYKKNKDIFHKLNKLSIEFNEKIKNENSLETGQFIWKSAKKIIAGGNMLFSKRPDAFLPDKWPSYFLKAKGTKIWDLDGRCYQDICLMGVGTNILGYANKNVDRAVKKRITQGNMSTLNCKEDVDLGNKLLNIHPWAKQVRFARTGGEANAIAIRLARAYTNKKKIAFCGYHGWHDWYLATNLRNKKNLNEHLLPGLNTSGVYKDLVNSIFPFNYNDIKGLEKLIKKHKDIGIIKMEVVRNEYPKNDFLKKVRKIADRNNLILIFDECTSGFRECMGGIHKKFNVEPDMLMLGKALGNGYAITAVLGKKEIMSSIKKTFISSTFWTESVGPTAALKTLELMEKKKSWIYITNLGKYIQRKWKLLAEKHNLKILIQGIPSLCSFRFQSKYHQEYKTFITQEMLKNNILATTTVYVSMAHNKKIIDRYLRILDRIFRTISLCEKGEDIFIHLQCKTSETDFARLN